MRQIILDTETTGLSPTQGHRIIEIGCIEIINRRPTGNTFHTYLQPERKVEKGAILVHGITDDFLTDKPKFIEIHEEFIQFIQGAELIIHNAPFDVGFIENEFLLIKAKNWLALEKHCKIIDTLILARQKHPGQRNNLDALCKRYGVSNQHRNKHGALLDAELLTEVYLLMTGGQNTLVLEEEIKLSANVSSDLNVTPFLQEIVIIKPSEEELAVHNAFLDKMEAKGNVPIWRTQDINE